MGLSVESFCNALVLSQLFKGPDALALRQRWLQHAGPGGADGDQFVRWLIAEKAVTEYQAGVLSRGNGDQLFLGPYLILDRVGKGSVAGVYRARHATGAVVAIKVLPPSKARDPQLLARFRREAGLALRLKSPHVVRTFQTGEAKGLHYLVMEYLKGETLDEVLRRRGKLSPAEVVRLATQTLAGLQALHAQKIVHRDLKPANLMVVGGEPTSLLSGTVKILDVGTGRAVGGWEAGALTNDSDLLGTPDYMAPEQARDPRAADVRADIYSVGCVLYHCLAGQPPFADSNPVRLLVRHATEAPRPLREWSPAVPDALEKIVQWMLAKDPAKRYPTPERAAKAFQAFPALGAEVVPLEKDPGMGAFLGALAAERLLEYPELEEDVIEEGLELVEEGPPEEEVPVVDPDPVPHRPARPVPTKLPAGKKKPPRRRREESEEDDGE